MAYLGAIVGCELDFRGDVIMEQGFPVDRLNEISQHPQDFRLLERVPFTQPDFINSVPVQLLKRDPNENTFPIVFLDTETTGLYYTSNKIIQLSMVRCTYSIDQNRIISVDAIFDGFEDPGEPIPYEVVELTGITDAMVRGKKLDDQAVKDFIVPGSLIVSHNAKFDRPFFDKRFGRTINPEEQPWACSLEEIEWKKMGFFGSKLEFITQSVGYFYDAHLAINDALTLCFLMYQLPAAMDCLLKSASRDSYRLDAINTKFELKDRLKAMNFRWDSGKKCWYLASANGQYILDTANKLQGLLPSDEYGQMEITRYTACERYRCNSNYGRQ